VSRYDRLLTDADVDSLIRGGSACRR